MSGELALDRNGRFLGLRVTSSGTWGHIFPTSARTRLWAISVAWPASMPRRQFMLV